MLPTTIYGLVDPATRELRYVGKTQQRPAQRKAYHESLARRRGRKSPVYCWIRSLHAGGNRPEMIELETVVTGDWREAETFWIAYARALGARLTNCTAGGDTGSSGYRHDAAARRRMSECQIGRKMPPEAVERMAATKRGKPISQEHRRSLSLKLKGRRNSPETIARMSAAQKGRTVSATSRQLISIALKGRRASPETKARLSAARKGVPKPEGFGARVSAAKKGKPLSPGHIAALRAAWARRKAAPALKPGA